MIAKWAQEDVETLYNLLNNNNNNNNNNISTKTNTLLVLFFFDVYIHAHM